MDTRLIIHIATEVIVAAVMLYYVNSQFTTLNSQILYLAEENRKLHAMIADINRRLDGNDTKRIQRQPLLKPNQVNNKRPINNKVPEPVQVTDDDIGDELAELEQSRNEEKKTTQQQEEEEAEQQIVGTCSINDPSCTSEQQDE